jgi:cytochrome c
MDSFELNKILGAVLGTLLFVMGVGFLAEAIYHPIEDRGPGYALPEPEVAEAGAPVEAAPEVALGTLLAAASADRGASAVRKCQSCHNFGEGEPNKTGPHLYDVVMRPEGSVPDFAYSDALKEHNANGDVWTYENLNAFLTSPKDYAPGTKMTFAGVKSPEERADILAYLQTLSADPKPFPEPDAAAPAEGEAAPADGEAAQADDAAAAPANDAAPEAPAPADAVDAGTSPAAVAPADSAVAPEATTTVETPTTTQSETPVVGTPAAGGDAGAVTPSTTSTTPPQ